MKTKENTACQMMNLLFGKAISFLLNMNFNKTINVFKINEQSLSLDLSGLSELYCVRLINKSNVYREYPNFEQLHDSIKFTDNARAYLYYVKKGMYQAIYVFSLHQDIVRQIAKDFSTEILTGVEIIDAIHDIFLIPEREIVDNSYKNIEYKNPDSKYEVDVMYRHLPQRIALASSTIFKKYTVYQGVSYQNNTDFSPVNFFKRKWNGVFSLMIDFSSSSVERHLKIKRDESQLGDKKLHDETKKLLENADYKEFLDDVLNKCLVVNSFLFIDNIDEISAISSDLKISFQENYLTSFSLIPKTIINARDTTFDYVIPIANVKKYFVSTHKKIIEEVKRKKGHLPDFYGKDINGAFVNYAYADNDNPHCIYIGASGSGKSVGICKTVSSIIGFDIKENKIKYLKDRKIKFCDVGYTAGGFIERLKEIEPERVEIISSRIETLRFSLFEIEKDSLGKAVKEDVLFTTYFINTMFEVSGMQSMPLMEEEKLIEAIEYIIENNIMIDYKLMEIEKFGLEKEVEEMMRYGYKKTDNISDLKEDIFHMFKKPTLQCLINYIENYSKRAELTTSTRNVYQSLLAKIESLRVYTLFAYYSNVDFVKNTNIYYIDFNRIKEDTKIFTATFWMLFKKWYKRDKEEAMLELAKGKLPIPSYYIIEEAHNFLSIPSFKKLLGVASREARKFHVYLNFISQKIEDIPDEIFSSISTRILYFKQDKKIEVKKSLREKKGGDIPPEEEAVFDKIEPFMAYIMHDEGVTGCNQMLTEEELALFIPKEIF